jgi:plastocyanin
MRIRGLAALCAVLLAVPLLVLAVSAQAATVVVTLSSDGPNPASVTIKRGDTVTFRNTDNVSHRIRRNAGAWSYDRQIPAGGSAVTPQFAAAGGFGYEDSFTIALLPQTVNGSITVIAPKPTATRSPTPSPRPSTTRSPTASPSPSGTPSATPSGLAITPPIGIATIPPTTAPMPNLAPPMPTSPVTTTAPVSYGSKADLVQSSPHRYGLPMALALLLAIGVLSLIARLLLSL